MTACPNPSPSTAPRLAAAVLAVVAGFGPAPAATADPATGRPAVTAQPGAGWHAVTGRAAGLATVATPLRADSVRAEQWQLDQLDAADAWRYADGSGVTVAVIDSGVDAGHPDLKGQVLPGIDLVDASHDGRTDPVGHGTTVAALIAGRSDDKSGVVGLAPRARILPVRVLDGQNRYDDATTVANGLRWAVDQGARVVNLSLGGVGTSEALGEAIDYAFDSDVVVVACTGNVTSPDSDRVWYPAREPGVLAVTGLTRDGDDPLWSNSLTGPQTVLAAPAADLLGARPGGYWRVQGTSFAAPLVAASAALIRSRWPQMSAADVVNRLVHTAHDLGAAGRDNRYGFGEVDPVAALTRTVPEVDRNPLDTQPPHGVARFGPAPDLAPVAGQEPSAPAALSSGTALTATTSSGSGARRAVVTGAAPTHRRPGPTVFVGLGACVVLIGLASLTARRD